MRNVTRHKVKPWLKARVLVRRHRLPFALGLAIFIALILVFTSVNIYILAGFNRYDLSRPGYAKERQEVARPAPQKTYDTTGTITAKAVTEFISEYDVRLNDLKAFGNFRDGSLNDEELGVRNTTSDPATLIE